MPRNAGKHGSTFRRAAAFALLLLLMLCAQFAVAGIEGGVTLLPIKVSTSFQTNFPQTDSHQFSEALAQQSVTPVIASVLQSSLDTSAQWLLTCPLAPNPSDTLGYFTSAPGSFIMGNRCLADKAPLTTTVTLGTLVTYSTGSAYAPGILAQASAPTLTIQNAGRATASVLAYAGTTAYQDTGENTISNGYNSESYVFGQVPASTQYGLWTWSAEYANLANVNTGALSFDRTLPLQVVPPGGSCNYDCHLEFQCGSNTILEPPNTLGDANTIGCIERQVCKTYTYTCEAYPVSYNYHVSASVTSLDSTQIPIPIATGDNYIEVNGHKYGMGEVGALPYLLLNMSIPASYSNINAQQENLNLSLNLYSAHNFLNPDGHLDAFPLYTDSGFFANYKGNGGDKLTMLPSELGNVIVPAGSDAFLSNTEVFGSALTSSWTSISGTNPKLLGKYYQINIPDPKFIAASPDDFVYVIGSATTHTGFFWMDTNTHTYLYKMRFIPSGDFNMSGYALDSTLTSAESWNSFWSGYWTNSMLQQDQNLYVVSATEVGNCNAWLFSIGKQCTSQLTINPFAMASDYAGDMFLVGGNSKTGKGFMMAEIPSNALMPIVQTALSTPSGFSPSAEFAASPNGDYVYTASPDYSGGVLVYQAPTLTGKDFAYVGNIPLSYSNSTYNLNLAQYMENGGPFNDPAVKKMFAGATAANDVAANHHPVAIENSKGLIYVLDNWTFSVKANGKNYITSILMLRAFGSNSVEIPIDGASSSAFVPVSSKEISLSQGTGATPANGWGPYGWPLSATITAPQDIQQGNTITYCAAYCTWTPSSTEKDTLTSTSVPGKLSTHYLPIGPRISVSSSGATAVGTDPNDFGLTMDFNDTLYMIAHTGAPFGTGVGVENAKTDYTELLVFKLALENYTRISYGADSPYQCYIGPVKAGKSLPDTAATETPCTVLPDTPVNGKGKSDTPAQVLANLYSPLMGVPSSFYYVESAGSPERYLTLQSILASALPFGASGYQEQANTLAQSGKFPDNTLATSNYLDLAISGSASALELPTTSINSIITGNFLVPYCTKYSMSQTWTATSGSTQILAPDGTACGICKEDMPAAQQYAQDYCTVASVPIQSNSLKDVIEGGGTYLQQLPNKNYLDANLSDAGSIGLPYLNYNIFTNRVFGAAYVNLTVNPADNYGYYKTRSSPMVVNAVRNLDYQLINYELDGQTVYSIQKAVPVGYTASSASGTAVSLTPDVYTAYTGTTISFDAQASGGTPPYTYAWTLSDGLKAEAGSCTSGSECTATLVPTTATRTAYVSVTDSTGATIGSASSTVTPESVVGADCGFACPQPYYYASNFFKGTSPLGYSSSSSTGFVTLLTLYAQLSQINNMILDLNNNPQLLGYNRFIYTFVDTFNNIIYAPVDTNFAYTAQISLTPDVTVNTLNPNESTVSISGSATYTTPSGQNALPDADIYLYYDTNLNYYDAANTPFSNPKGYYQDSLLCAFSPSGQTCQLANPLYTNVQEQPIGADEAKSIMFHPDYNAIGQCMPEPKSLLAAGNIVVSCNIYGDYGLPAAKMLPNGDYQYCLPEYQNGNGILTSQLGLIAVLKTDGSGEIAPYTFNVCGTGEHRIIASYYGNPPPQPSTIVQTPIAQSAGSGEFSNPGSPQNPQTIASQEFTYEVAPASAYSGITIGSYALSFGSIGAIGVLILAAIAVALARRKS